MEPEPQGLDEALAQNEELCVSLRDPVAVREEERDGVTVSEPQGEGLVLSELVLQALNDTLCVVDSVDEGDSDPLLQVE